MVSVRLDVVGAVSGIIGAVTGVISLAWHILKSKPKLKLENTYFVKGGFGTINARGQTHVGVKLNFRNLGNRSATIENVNIIVGNSWNPVEFFKPVTVRASSSEKIETELRFPEKKFKDFYVDNKIDLGVSVVHTFGTIKKSGTTNFTTGHFTIK